MKEIINTILRYNDDESWYCYGVEELADMLKAKSEIGWENRTDEIIKQIQCYEMPDNLNELIEQLASAVINLDIQMEHEIVKKLREEMKTT